MIRVILFLVSVAVFALAAAWVVDRPGDVAVTWMGYRIETSVTVAAVGLVLLLTACMIVWSLIRMLLRSPDIISMIVRNRRGARGYHAISRGLIAVGSGDVRAARKFADEAERLAPREPLALLLQAQTAQLSGDRQAAESAFRAMAQRHDTKALGLRGLFVEAQRRQDALAARACAEEAAKLVPPPAWAGQAVLEFRSARSDWAGALATVENNWQNKQIDRASYRRQRAVLLTAQARAAEDTEPERAKMLALEAVKLTPDLVPAVALGARLLADGNELRKASRMIEKAWRAAPHPDLADVYMHLRHGDSARDRLTRAQALADKAPNNIESALAVAHAAIDAREFAIARAALAPFVTQPTQRVAELMAELEQTEHGDQGRAREWISRALRAARDPAWTADGFISEQWMPVSPVSGRLDAFQWKVPLAELGGGAVIEPEEIEPKEVKPAGALPGAAAQPSVVVPAPAGSAARSPSAVQEPHNESLTEAARPPRRVHRDGPLPGVPPEAVIPLIHVPDDPGPGASLESEPDPTPEPPEAWRRIRPSSQ